MTNPASISGFYMPLKDLYFWLRDRRNRSPRIVRCEVQQMGETTWIVVEAQAGRRARTPTTVSKCRAERFEKAFDSPMKAEPVREKTIKMLPAGPVKLSPGEAPTRWEARFLTEHLRRAARQGEEEATSREMGPEVVEIAKAWRQREDKRRASRRLVPRILAAVDGPPRVSVRIVLQLVDHEPVASERFDVPPVPSTFQRVLAVLRANQ